MHIAVSSKLHLIIKMRSRPEIYKIELEIAVSQKSRLLYDSYSTPK